MTHQALSEHIDSEIKRRKSRFQNAGEVVGIDGAGVGGDEVEECVFRAGSVLENRVDGGNGAAQVLGIDRHRDVDEGGIANLLSCSVVGAQKSRAADSVRVFRRF